MMKGNNRKLIGLRALAALLLAVSVCILLLENGKVQTTLMQKAVRSIENDHLRIQAGSIRVVPFSAVILDDLLVTDADPYLDDPFDRGYPHTDTLFKADRISATFTLKGLFSKDHLCLGRVRIDGCSYCLQVEPWSKDLRNNLGTLGRVLNLPPPSETFSEFGDIFEIKKLEINDFRYTMRTFATRKAPYIGSGVNWGFIDARAHKLRAHRIKCLGGKLRAYLDRCDISEASGLEGNLEHADLTVEPGKVTIAGSTYTDAESVLNMDEVLMTYNSPYSFQEFPDSVRLDVIFTDSHLTIRTVSSFLGGMDDIPLGFDIERAVVSGPVNRMHIVESKAVEDSGVELELECTVSNLFKKIPIEFEFNPKRISFNTSQIENIIERFGGKPSGISLYAGGKTFDLAFHAEGIADNFVFSGEASMDGGRIGTDFSFDRSRSKSSPEVAGNIFLDNLEVGEILGSDDIGQVSMHFSAESILGRNKTVKVSDLEISKLTALGYAYSGISGNGTFTGKRFDGKVISRDPNLNFIFQGIFDFAENSSDKLYKFFATVAYADLKALNLDKIHPVSELSTGVISANLRSMDKGSALVGEASVSDILFTDNQGHHDIGDINLTSQITSDAYKVQLSSSFAEGGYIGNESFSTVAGSIISTSVRRELPSLFSEKDSKLREFKGATFDIKLNLHDSYNLMSLIKPGLYIADGTGFKASMDSSGFISSDLVLPGLAMGESIISNLRISTDNRNDRLSVSILGDEAKSGPFHLTNVRIDATADRDTLSAEATYSLKGSHDCGKIVLLGNLSRDSANSLTADISDRGSDLFVNGQHWIPSPWTVHFSDKGTAIRNFALSCEGQEIYADGLLSRTESGKFKLGIGNLDLDILSIILPTDIRIGGLLNADAGITSPMNGFTGLEAAITADALSVNGEESGGLTGTLEFADEETMLVHIEGINPGGRNGLNADASLMLDTRSISATADFDGFDVRPLAVFAKDVLEKAEGHLDGSVDIEGTTESLEISCDSLKLSDGYAKVRQTGVAYSMDGVVNIDGNGPLIRNFNITDGEGGSAILSGRIPGAGMNIRNLKVLDKRDRGDGLFGSLRINGDISLQGESISAMEINANLSTSGSGLIDVNVSGTADNPSAASILSFRPQLEESTEKDPQYIERAVNNGNEDKEKTSATVRASIGISPEVEIVLGLDQDGVNMLNTRGSGIINLEMNASGNDSGLSGTYDIQSGKYHLSVLGTLVNKDFVIQQGSSLRFGGDLPDTEFDVRAVHSLRASLGPLISDTTSVSTQRTVNCGISISDKLRSPELAFSIDVPDLDPTTSALVQSELNTEDKIQKQFLGLLVTGSFIPSEQGGGVVDNTGSNILYKNLSMIMSGQLNSILQKLGIPVDLGLNYQQNEAGKDIFDVAISTQMLNNRVLVNGTIGNRQFSTRSNGEMVGDIDVQIKLDRAGNTRMSLFSHSADDYTNYLDNTQRSGIGISYQKEFNRLRDLFTKKEKKKDE